MPTVRVIYRLGSATDDALTPRPGKDTTATVGQQPGLSVWESGPKPGQKAQKIDPSLLTTGGLAYFPDDPATGGQAGHGVIALVNAVGRVDQVLLEEWASYRGTGKRHRFTQAILDAIAEADFRSTT